MVFGDRTREFSHYAQNLRNRGVVPRTRKTESDVTKKLNFNRAATEIGRHTFETAQKLKELTRLAKSQSLFDDPADKIEELTGIIKLDIQNIRKKIEDLQILSDTYRHRNKQSSDHNVKIIDALKSGLTDTTDQFAKVLEVRTENLKSQQDRKEKFMGTRKITASPVIYQPFSPDLDENQEEDFNEEEVSIALPLVQTKEQYLQQRSQSIRAVERTIEELKGIMSQVARLTHEQDHLITRIDENIMDAEVHIDGAYKQLVEYLSKVSSQRWLFLKIFAVLTVFIILFVVFFM